MMNIKDFVIFYKVFAVYLEIRHLTWQRYIEKYQSKKPWKF